MRRPRHPQDAEAVRCRERGQDPYSYTPSEPRGATGSNEGLGPVRLLLTEKYVAARLFFGATYGAWGLPDLGSTVSLELP